MTNLTTDSYMELIGQFPLRRLRTATDHSKAKTLVLRLSRPKLPRGLVRELNIQAERLLE